MRKSIRFLFAFLFILFFGFLSAPKISKAILMQGPSPADIKEEFDPATSIELKNIEDNKIKWKPNGYANSFKVVWSKTKHPTCIPRTGDEIKHFIGTPHQGEGACEPKYSLNCQDYSLKSVTFDLDPFDEDGYYYVKVCSGNNEVESEEKKIYLGGENNSKKESEPVKSITLSGDGKIIEWETDGYAGRGFLVIWGKEKTPSSPAERSEKVDIHSFTSPKQTADVVEPFDGDGYYYVRVCEHLGNAECGVYSNEIKVYLGDKINIPSSQEKATTSISSTSPQTEEIDKEFSKGLKGRILLQVEKNGEAYYVNPEDKKRCFLGRPVDAFNIMRELGIGISEERYNSFNGYAPESLSGKILLRAGNNGEAYYVNPGDLKMHYLGRPSDAFEVMRNLGVGVTNENLNKIPSSSI